ncbi:IclR family transcriptional regulator C-terminal domain-containing protein [Opitutus sp. ER46]|uniref:IclR family transcriptional regulator n=1 Tax=Opitutus sp. ER46 TaxID=2161864 RepID=UPI000D3086EB|nr:IclR family transcriptional regulator C-terminal domain-containing protein [Opitutus sp. ER46]PTX91699.1 transcriptional regulator [Opitutus sp. ER46]
MHAALNSALPPPSDSGPTPGRPSGPAEARGPDATRHHSSMFRGIEALTTLLKARHSLGITQLARELNLSKSTAHDLVAALSALGFVDQDRMTRRYSVSPAIFSFLHLFSTEYGPNSAIRPLLRARARRLKATLVVSALCRRSTYALCGSGSDADTFLLGDSGPAYNSACGKILVAQQDPGEWAGFAPSAGDTGSSPYLRPDPERFLAELKVARATGVAWSLRERDPALCSVAAPVRIGEEPWSCAVGIALPYSEWVARDREELAGEVRSVAAELYDCWAGGVRRPAAGVPTA